MLNWFVVIYQHCISLTSCGTEEGDKTVLSPIYGLADEVVVAEFEVLLLERREVETRNEDDG
jgi:hypothetical protein